MKIWVDADSCPVVIKEILFRAANRAQITTILVANHAMRIPPSEWIKFQQVQAGFDVADNKIVQQIKAGDLLICADIPLASEAIEKGATVISPRGERYTLSNIKARLTMRDFMQDLRDSGVETGGQKPFNQADRQSFANELDRFINSQ